jgi:hypothetical protein
MKSDLEIENAASQVLSDNWHCGAQVFCNCQRRGRKKWQVKNDPSRFIWAIERGKTNKFF